MITGERRKAGRYRREEACAPDTLLRGLACLGLRVSEVLLLKVNPKARAEGWVIVIQLWLSSRGGFLRCPLPRGKRGWSGEENEGSVVGHTSAGRDTAATGALPCSKLKSPPVS